MFFTDEEIDRLIAEDLPYIDLTTHALGIEKEPGAIRFTARTAGVAACTEEAARILERAGASTTFCLESGESFEAGTLLLEAQGEAKALHAAWKVCQNMLEYAGGIATYTRAMAEAAGEVPIFTTRKSPPGFKKIAMKSVMSGGGHPHRLGLSESFLLFDNHRVFLEPGRMAEQVGTLARQGALLEQRVAVETSSLEEALDFAERGVRLFQLEKFRPGPLAEAVRRLKALYPDIRLLATGGIRLENAAEYASAGVDGLITTAPYYYARPVDIGVRMERL